MAEINISNLGGGGGGTLTLTTTGTGGASTYVAGVLNIPVYQSALTNPVTGTGTATRVAFWDSASSVSSSANLYWDNSNSFLGVGTTTPGARLQVNGSGLTSGTTGLSVKDSGGTDNFTVADNGATFVRGVLTISGSSASSSATLMGRTSTGEVTSVTLGTNLSFSGNTLNASGGSGSPAGSTGEIQFNSAGAFGASSNLFWNNAAAPTGQRLGVGTSSPGARLQIDGVGATSSTSGLLVRNSSGTEGLRVRDDGFVSGTNSLEFAKTATSDIDFSVLQNATSGTGYAIMQFKSKPGNTALRILASGEPGSASANFIQSANYDYTGNKPLYFSGYYSNQGSDVKFNFAQQNFTGKSVFGATTTFPTITTPLATLHSLGANTSSGTNNFLVQNSTPSDLYKIENNGKISYWATNTAAGTTGSQTINRPSGTVNFAAAASALTVTNALCTTSSIVFATVRTNDTTAYIKNVVPGSGSFTINLGAAATAETSVGFWIIN